MRLPAEISSAPKFLSFKIVTVQTVGPERDNDPLAIGDGRSGTIRICRMGGFLLARRDCRLPEHFTVGAIEADERAPFAERLSDEDALLPDHWGRISGFRQRCAPFDMIGGAPLDRKILLLRNAGAHRSAPRRPIGGANGKAQEMEQY